MSDQEQIHTNNKKSKRIVMIILLLVLIAGVIFGITEYVYYRSYQTTDDAQVDGDINPVIARVTGYVKEIRFKDNQIVHAGDTLVVLDDRDYRLRLEEAQAGLDVSHAEVEVSQANVFATTANVAPAQAETDAATAQFWQADQDYQRYKNLLEKHAVTQSQFDAVKAKRDAAEAQLTAAKKRVIVLNEQVQTTQQQLGAAKSGVTARQAAIDFAKLQLSYTVITAPVSGIVSKRNIQTGQLVSAGQAMFAVVNTNNIYVTANFKETQLEKIKPGQKVEIDVDAYSGQKFKGVVQSFSGATGAKFSLLPPDNATGNFIKVIQRVPVRIDFEELTPDWRLRMHPGLNVEVKVRIKD